MIETILGEIRRIAGENGGVPPGQNSFTKTTGIGTSKWRGVLWVRWSEALAEAGFVPNKLNSRLDENHVIEAVAHLTLSLRKLPTHAEILMARRRDPNFPSHQAIREYCGAQGEIAATLRKLAEENDLWEDLLSILPKPNDAEAAPSKSGPDGFVYLLKSGQHYKIGRSQDIERRFREIKITLPENVTMLHSIRTDDPAGIEAYWHRRFSDRRANGEWFKLSPEDVRAFCRRTFQ